VFAAYARASVRPRHLTTLFATVAIMIAVIVIPAAPAAAKPTIAQIEAQIAAADAKLEPIIENYDKIHAELTANQAKAAVLEKSLSQLQLESMLATTQIAQISASLYEAGPPSTLSVLMNADSTLQALDAISMLNAAAKQRLLELKPMFDKRDQYAAAKKKLDDARVQLAAQNADLNSQAKTIEAQLGSLQKLRQQVYGTTGAIGTLRPVACPFTYTSGKGGIAARKACTAIGKPYVWATAGPSSFDCSGLTLWAWAAAGVTLSHYTKWQWDESKSVSRANLQPGDLVFFYPPSLHHVAIYVGGGWVVHAPHTGDYVRMAQLSQMSDPIAGYRRP
jgi:cell wall-associated NlpC family hydrolase